MAADVMNDLIESKETPAEISTWAGLDPGPIGLDPGPIGLDPGPIGFDPGPIGFDPGPIGFETPLPTQLVRNAMVKFNAQNRQQPWLGISGQPVPDSDGGVLLDFDAAAQVFGQLGGQNWNPMIVQPAPEGDMESNQAGAKEVPRNVGAMKMAMAGQRGPGIGEPVTVARAGHQGPSRLTPSR